MSWCCRTGADSAGVSLRLDPSWDLPLIDRGSDYLKIGDLDRALTDLDRAIQLNPGSVNAFVDRCMTYTDENDRAIEDCDSALRIEPDDPADLTNRGVAYAAEGQFDRAMEDFDHAIRLDP